MTEQEVIELLRFAYPKEITKPITEECISMAVNALEKQIPKVPTYEGDGMYYGQIVIDTWVCPNCGKEYEVDYDDYEYCPKCGQHIDHSTLTEDD